MGLYDEDCDTCQCPLGLIPHFYRMVSKTLCAYRLVCQCPLGLIPHFYPLWEEGVKYVKETVSMPSRAYTSFLHENMFTPSICEKIVSMPSRAYTSFLRYHFKNLGFMRFPEPVFAGICQNILTTAVFRAC